MNYDEDDDWDIDDDDDAKNNNDDDDDVFPKTFFVEFLYLKPYQSDQRCLKASFQLNQGTRKVGLLALKIILDYSPFHMDIGFKRQNWPGRKNPHHFFYITNNILFLMVFS